jgi:hypothetical protein
MNKIAPRAVEHAARVSGDDDAREAGRAAAVQLRHAGHTPVGSMRHKRPKRALAAAIGGRSKLCCARGSSKKDT